MTLSAQPRSLPGGMAGAAGWAGAAPGACMRATMALYLLTSSWVSVLSPAWKRCWMPWAHWSSCGLGALAAGAAGGATGGATGTGAAASGGAGGVKGAFGGVGAAGAVLMRRAMSLYLLI